MLQLPVCPRPGDLVSWRTGEKPLRVKQLLIVPDGINATVEETLVYSRTPMLDGLAAKRPQRSA
jgi:hypothetical protein